MNTQHNDPDLNKCLDQRHPASKVIPLGSVIALFEILPTRACHSTVFYCSYVIYFVIGPNMGRCLVVCSHELVKNGAYGNLGGGVFKRGIQN